MYCCEAIVLLLRPAAQSECVFHVVPYHTQKRFKLCVYMCACVRACVYVANNFLCDELYF